MTDTAIVVRGFESKDALEVQRLVLGIQREEFGVPITLDDQPDLHDVPAHYGCGAGGFWVACAAGAVVGTVGLLDIGHGHGALRRMFVAPRYRGSARGVAAALLRTCLRHAADAGMSDVFLGTADAFRAAHRFYEKSGFTEIPADRLPGHFPRTTLDTRFYRYRLGELVRPGAEAFDEIVDVLSDAFADYPVMRYVLGEEGAGDRGRLGRLIGFFVRARLLRRDLILGLRDDAGPSAVALVTLPESTAPPELEAAREETWAALGPGARTRYERFSTACAPFAVAEPHLHLNMLAVRRARQGRGLARLLLARLHESSRSGQAPGVSPSPPRIPRTCRSTSISATAWWDTRGWRRGSRAGASSGGTRPPSSGRTSSRGSSPWRRDRPSRSSRRCDRSRPSGTPT